MILSVKGLTKTYKNKRVLDIPAHTVDGGKINSIIGPNGAGKSTLIKILAGLESPCTGTVLYNGCKLDSQVQKKITLLFQKPYMLGATVYENIAYPLRLRNVDKSQIHEKVSELLQALNLEDVSQQNALTLSGGEAQKVALARALVFSPDLVLLDEPTASIDPVSTLLIEKLVKGTNKRLGTTFLWITHNINQAKRTSEKVVFMYQGKVMESGDTEEVLDNPANVITKRFVSGDLII